jgi:hypothetical protein
MGPGYRLAAKLLWHYGAVDLTILKVCAVLFLLVRAPGAAVIVRDVTAESGKEGQHLIQSEITLNCLSRTWSCLHKNKSRLFVTKGSPSLTTGISALSDGTQFFPIGYFLYPVGMATSQMARSTDSKFTHPSPTLTNW